MVGVMANPINLPLPYVGYHAEFGLLGTYEVVAEQVTTAVINYNQ